MIAVDAPYQVVTVGEAVRLFDRCKSLIHYHIINGDLNARKSHATYIIGLDSLIMLWGQPKKSLDDCP